MKALMVETAPPPATRTETLLELRGLQVEYGYDALAVRAVDGIDLQIRQGEILGLAGESGCGKTTIANAVMRILRPPGRISGGSVVFRGEDLVGKSDEDMRQFRWRNVSMVFQSAMNALNPVMRVGDQFVDAMRAHERIDKKSALAALKAAEPQLVRAARKGVVHKKTASRKISRLTRRLAKLP